MGQTLDEAGIARTLVGEWNMGASNIESWVDGSRRDASFRFAVEQESPLVISEEQVFTLKDGKERRNICTNQFHDGEFVSKMRRFLGTMSRWSIRGVSDDGSILIIRMTHARGGQDGLMVMVRRNSEFDELRATLATQSDEFGLGPEDFASLTWLPLVSTN